MAQPTALDTVTIQRRTVWTLSAAQVFSGLGSGSTLALGSILAVQLSDSDIWAGASVTAMTLGAAFAAVPLSGLALRRGRRFALTAGLAGAVLGTVLIVISILTAAFPVLLLGSAGVGLASAVNLQARFAVTDLADPKHRARDLSLVVWAVTIGAVIGPNLVTPGAMVAGWFGLPVYTGAFLISGAAMIIGGSVIWLRLHPDPLLTRQRLDAELFSTGRIAAPRISWRSGWAACRPHPSAKAAILAVAGAHAVMVAVMSMTPLQLQHEAGGMGAHPDTIKLIGITISVHIAGMYALSPVMGWLADHTGPRRVVMAGLGAEALGVALAGGFNRTPTLIAAGLILLGLGWSAATVAGAALLVAALPSSDRVAAQGFSDATMSFGGAAAAAMAGPVMSVVGYLGLGVLAGAGAVLAAVGVALLTRSDVATSSK